MEATMKTVTLEWPREDVSRRALEAFRGRKQSARISFSSPELLWKVLTAKRWELLKTMTGQGPLTIREVARRLGRDVKAVHGDVHALLDAGLLDKTEKGRVVFPFDAVRVSSRCAQRRWPDHHQLEARGSAVQPLHLLPQIDLPDRPHQPVVEVQAEQRHDEDHADEGRTR
jgi:predicted transcriptional regulator